MSYNIKINQVQSSRVSEVDINNIAMGNAFTDHMFVCDYENGAWINPRIEPLTAIPTHPAAMALHYGQAIFEGMKATLGNDNVPLLFRPMENAKRLNFSADRMGMPSFPEDLFVESLKQLVALEKNWIPSEEGAALYLRPFMYADEAFIGMRAATRYKFIVIASPAGPFFSKPIKLYAETKYIRAAIGGTGEAKAAGNYAGAIRPTELAKAKGYDQVLWLDANEFEYIQEVGTMNVFFKIGGKFITPDLSGSILAGITRMSVIDVLRDKGFEVTERPIKISEIIEASQNGTLEEAFGAGTAVGIAMIEEIGYKDMKINFPKANPVSHDVNDTLNAIKTQKTADKFGWIVPAVTTALSK
ncbi:branched-chain amino acid aminotransferase/4-amino-4-deoxychorismate lyase family protein [Flavobacterium enshiense DK69]|uniref:Branched-chain-amino-acid aminotransferase n=1 Tax=Flavobacterium enshiense DK69 TaxID=1107311 RepID=V6SG86_9FLAO|nr:branched-chain amino acid aminotransferase [Flavobacterium enshiense]ESU23430.1 branched-chain amino acid aminotransferase/4-amino-4-deoxychorismate lyase family protein [Flavobacterium enshiense DK69]KGO96345.1 branched-chain amino acid aminotransferase [Flavobacterium enshiense DK69]